MSYLYINRATGVVMLLGFIFFCCAITALRGSEIKTDFRKWQELRKAKKAATTQPQEGLHR
jgi:hypothetical protein